MTSISYEIHVSGVVPPDVLDELQGLNATIQPVGTVLHGPVPDQAALHGIISRLQAFGLQLIEVRRLPDEPARDEVG